MRFRELLQAPPAKEFTASGQKEKFENAMEVYEMLMWLRACMLHTVARLGELKLERGVYAGLAHAMKPYFKMVPHRSFRLRLLVRLFASTRRTRDAGVLLVSCAPETTPGDRPVPHAATRGYISHSDHRTSSEATDVTTITGGQ